MKNFYNNFLFFLVLLSGIAQIASAQCCLKFSADKCVKCPPGTHLFRDNCIYDIKNCQIHKDGFQCEKCKTGFGLDKNKCLQLETHKNETLFSNVQTNSTFKTVDIDFINLESIKNLQLVDQFVISDEIFKSHYSAELNNAQTTKAQQIIYENGTTHISIEYINTKKQEYKGLIIVNMKSFIFKVISFEQTNQKDKKATIQTKKNTNTLSNSSISQPKLKQQEYAVEFNEFNGQFKFPASDYVSSEIDFSNSSQAQFIGLLDQQAMAFLQEELKSQLDKKVKKIFKKDNSSTSISLEEMITNKIRTYTQNMKKFVVIMYMMSDKTTEYIAIGQISAMTDNRDILPIQLVYAGFNTNILNKITKTSPIIVKNPQPNTTQKDSKPNPTIISGNTNQTQDKSSNIQSEPQTNNSFPSQTLKAYQNMSFIQISGDKQLLGDIFYVLSINQIHNQLKDYENIDPEKVFRASLENSPKNSPNQNIQELKTNNYYKLLFRVKNQSFQIIILCNLITFKPKIIEAKKILTSNAPTILETKSSNNTLTANSSNLSQTKTNKSHVLVPEGFIKSQNIGKLNSNVYYLIAMDTLLNIDKKYSGLKAAEVYTKDQTTSTKIHFLIKYDIPLKNNSDVVQVWVVQIDVLKSSFRAQIIKNQLVETINQPVNYKKQNQQVVELSKDDLIQKNTLPVAKPLGKVIMLRADRDRILIEQSY